MQCIKISEIKCVNFKSPNPKKIVDGWNRQKFVGLLKLHWEQFEGKSRWQNHEPMSHNVL